MSERGARLWIGQFADEEPRPLGDLWILIEAGGDQRLDHRFATSDYAFYASGQQGAQNFHFNRGARNPLAPREQRRQIRTINGITKMNNKFLISSWVV
jgi:hypothetical protein